MAQTDWTLPGKLTPSQIKRARPVKLVREHCAEVAKACALGPLDTLAEMRLLNDLKLNRLGSVNRVNAPVRNYG